MRRRRRRPTTSSTISISPAGCTAADGHTDCDSALTPTLRRSDRIADDLLARRAELIELLDQARIDLLAIRHFIGAMRVGVVGTSLTRLLVLGRRGERRGRGEDGERQYGALEHGNHHFLCLK